MEKNGGLARSSLHLRCFFGAEAFCLDILIFFGGVSQAAFLGDRGWSGCSCRNATSKGV